MAKTSASFTLMDYTDGVSLITGIDSNLPLTSLYDTSTQTLSPSWEGSTSLILTPSILKAGSSTSLISLMTNKKWYRRIAGGDWTQVISGSNGETMNNTTGALTVAQDKLIGNVWQIDYKFSGTYPDPVLLLDFPIEIKVTLSRVANGTSFVVARAYTTGGSQFKNELPSSLVIKAELIRGTTKDNTNLSYEWKKSTNGNSWTTVTGSTDSLSITPSMVDSFAMFKCIITDTDSASDTYNQSFETEGVSILDVSDPYQAVIESTAGSYFKNGSGSTILICKVYQNGVEVDETGASMTYTWTKTDKNGAAVTSFDPSGVAVSSKGILATKKKAISVSSSDIDVKAVYFCEVS